MGSQTLQINTARENNELQPRRLINLRQ